MRFSEKNGEKWVTLAPGELYVSKEKLVMTTLLGSCVSVCLYDEVKGVAGMNHFMLTENTNRNLIQKPGVPPGRYGSDAMKILIDKLSLLGASERSLKAKFFGGGNVLGFNNNAVSADDSITAVGRKNIEYAEKYLNKMHIPIISRDVGGERGRVIIFRTSDFSVLTRKLSSPSEYKCSFPAVK